MKNKTAHTKDVDCVFEKLGDDVLLLSVEIVYVSLNIFHIKGTLITEVLESCTYD